MSAATTEHRLLTVEATEERQPSPYLLRVLDEIERANAQREKPAKRQRPATERAPRPFAHD
ncbi:MAG: hypothetical protein NZT92_22585 [Abditibacteriales bacterium]|nr:hypothetical protein [Abditibacteriales bacterium]